MVTVATKFGLRNTVTAGIIGAVLFAVFETLAAVMLMGSEEVFTPLRMISAIVLGAAALDPGYSLLVAAIGGTIVHVVLSMAFALAFASVASPRATDSGLAIAGIVFGTLLWVVNFYVIAPLAGWQWLPEQTNAIVQFIAHACFYGCPVGWYLARSRSIIVYPSS